MPNLPIAKSPLQIYRTKEFAGMSESNHLINAFLTEPTKLAPYITYAMSNSVYTGEGATSVMSLLTGGIGNTKTTDNSVIEWTVAGPSEKVIEVLGNYSDGGATPGISNSTFRVRLAEKWFSATDEIRAEDGTMCRISEEPYQDGAGYVYTLQLAAGDGSKFISASQIAPGATFVKMFSTVEEASLRGGGTSFGSHYALRNRLTTLRKDHTVSRDAATDRLVFKIPTQNGKTSDYWVRMVEWQFMAQWFREKDLFYIYGEYNQDPSTKATLIAGENGRPVLKGAGLRQQISPSNVRYYSTLTYSILEDILSDLSSYGTVGGGNSNFVGLTGRLGMRQFSNAIKAEFAGTSPNIIVNEGTFMSGSGTNLTFKGEQWVKATFPDGNTFTLRHFAPYDDPWLHRQLDPISGKPVESGRITILDFGTDRNGEANIQKFAKNKSEDVMWSTGGSIDASGNTRKSFTDQSSNGFDGYTIHALTQEAIIVRDPQRSAELILSVDF